MSARLISFLACLALCASAPAAAITLGQIDDFEDGGTTGWTRGASSTTPPANFASGGPDGADDNYLHSISTGVGRADSRMVMFNNAQWTGDYVAAGVGAIRMMVNNLGDTTLHLRVALEGGSVGTRFSSFDAAVIAPGSGWVQVVFGLSDSDLIGIIGSDSLQQVLSDVQEVRVLSSSGGLSWIADQNAGILGVDDLEAVATSVATDASSVSTMKTAWD